MQKYFQIIIINIKTLFQSFQIWIHKEPMPENVNVSDYFEIKHVLTLTAACNCNYTTRKDIKGHIMST